MSHRIILDGASLTVEDVYRIAYGGDSAVSIAPTALRSVEKANAFLEKEFNKKVIYGVNTGFGPMASQIVGRKELVHLQENLIRGHAMGIGAPLPEPYVVAAMVVRLNTLLKGYSGVSPALVKKLQMFINTRIVPVVPDHGAVGTSGDLVQLAHIALALIGEGEVFYKGKRRPTAKVLEELHIAPYALKPKEGLSLINGTSMMSGIASLLCMEARRLVSLSITMGAFSLESVHAFTDAFSARLQEVRPHRGQMVVAQALRTLLASSALLRDRAKFQRTHELTDLTHKIPESVQEIYSLRCIPQVVGPVFDVLAGVTREAEVEINAATDNPIVDWKSGSFLHGGNFHGDYIAAGMDRLKSGLVKLTMLSERQTNFFLNEKANNFFPPFMNLKTPGLTMGLQGLQFVATSTTARSQTLAFPQYVHSIPTNGDNQDIVSMGTDAALLAAQVIENAYVVLTVQVVTLAQAADFLGTLGKYSAPSAQLFRETRKIFPAITADRAAAQELARLLRFIKSRPLLDITWR